MFKAEPVEGGVVRFVMARRLLGKDLYRAACYLVDGLLIDTGIPLLCGRLSGALSGRPVSAVVNTHAHEDHMGANAILQESRCVPVFAHRKALPVLADPGKLSLLPYQKLFFGEPSPSKGLPIGTIVRTERHEFKVVDSPGHSPDHVVLYEENRGWLFSGDAFIAGQDRVFREGYDLPEMARTFRKLSALGAETMFTGMGNVIGSPARKIQRKLAYYEEITHKIETMRREGMEAPEIAKRLFPGDRTVRIVTSGNFSAAHLVRSVLAASGEPPGDRRERAG
jgi:glyoxylase-like metal-dependent hydrolase (beta-lactamase superfamily II)